MIDHRPQAASRKVDDRFDSAPSINLSQRRRRLRARAMASHAQIIGVTVSETTVEMRIAKVSVQENSRRNLSDDALHEQERDEDGDRATG